MWLLSFLYDNSNKKQSVDGSIIFVVFIHVFRQFLDVDLILGHISQEQVQACRNQDSSMFYRKRMLLQHLEKRFLLLVHSDRTVVLIQNRTFHTPILLVRTRMR